MGKAKFISLELWKNADNDTRILQVARREYLALSHSAGGTAGGNHTVHVSIPIHERRERIGAIATPSYCPP